MRAQQAIFPVLAVRAPDRTLTTSSDPTSSRFFLTHAFCEWSGDGDILTVSRIAAIAENSARRSKYLKLRPGQKFTTRVYEITKTEDIPVITDKTQNACQTAYARINDAFLDAHAIELDHTYALKGVENPAGLIAVVELLGTRSALSPAPKGCESNAQDREAIASAARRRESPSVGVRVSARIRTQTPSRIDAVYNHRPISLSALPISVYSPVFARFARRMADTTTTVQFTHEELEDARAFVEHAVAYYPTKAARAENSRAMARAVHPDILARSAFTLSGKTRCTPDGVVQSTDKLGDFAPVLALCAVRAEIGEGSSDPAAEAECAYVAIYSSEEAKPLRALSCCPALLVAYAGPNVQVLGAVFSDQIVVQPLTDYISAVPRPAPDRDAGRSPDADAVLRVARVFRALKASIEDLREHYGALVAASRRLSGHRSQSCSAARGPGVGTAPSHAPALTSPHFTEFSLGDGATARLVYKERLSKQWPNKAVFRAEAKLGSEVVPVVVKFTHSYGADAHALLAGAALAPALRHCAYEGDVGTWVVVMDYVEGGADWTALPPGCAASLRAAVRTLHAHDMVFGDLRAPNVLALRGGGVVVIDFDWAGRVGSARFPFDVSLDAGIAWPEGVRRGGLIEKEHDLELLEKVIAGEV